MLSLEERLDPAQTALIVIDVQNDFCHEDGGCARLFGANVSEIQKAMPALERLLEGARTAGTLVVFVRSLYDEVYLSPVRRDQQSRRGSTKLCQTDTWGAEFYGPIAPDPSRSEIVVVKHRFNAFAGTTLDAALRGRGVTRVICCGFTTSICVESTARDAFFHDYYTMIAADAVAEFDPEFHYSTLRVFDRSFGVVLPVDDILTVWGQYSERAIPSVAAGS